MNLEEKKPDRRSIISFDLDMTLLDHRTYQIPDSAMKAVERLRRNHRIVIASGGIWIIIIAVRFVTSLSRMGLFI